MTGKIYSILYITNNTYICGDYHLQIRMPSIRRKFSPLVFILILLATGYQACKHDPDEIVDPDDPHTGIPCDPDTVYFENDILPLLQSSCGMSGCHDPGTAQDDVILTNYADIIATGDVEPGDPQDSDLYEVITEDDPDKRMPPPPQSPLTAAQIQMIYTWVQQGAQNNYCDQEDCDTVNVTFSGTVMPVIQNNCTGCHSGATPGGGITLETHSDIVTVADNGRLMGSITHSAGFSPMPQNGDKLSDCTIAQIQKWIDNGTPND